MQINDLLDKELLKQHITDGMVKEQIHPENDRLRILNYTQTAQFSRTWDDVTEQCRGLIYDALTREVHSRPFRKFHNLGTETRPETMLENLPATTPTITQKYDGSLGVGYKVGNQWRVATRGSFTSEQAQWATVWLDDDSHQNWPYGWTPLFEIIYPANRIVVNYDYSGLVLLTLVNIETGAEMAYPAVKLWAEWNHMRVAEVYDKPLHMCTTEDIDNEEGYVCAWHLNGGPPLRVKVKFETYCRLHKLITQSSPISIWDILRNHGDLWPLLKDVPNDFKLWVKGVVDDLLRQHYKIDSSVVGVLQDGVELGHIYKLDPGPGYSTLNTRKEVAEVFKAYSGIQGLLFAAYDGKPIDQLIWKMIRPRGDARTFKVDEG